MKKRNLNRAKSRIKHVSKYYVEVVSDTKYRVLSAFDVERMIENNPANKEVIKNYIPFDSCNDAMKYVNKALGFSVYGIC